MTNYHTTETLLAPTSWMRSSILTQTGQFLSIGAAILLLATSCGYASEDDLATGDCIEMLGNTTGNQSFKTVDCETVAGIGIWEVVWNIDAEGEWPQAVDQLAGQCEGRSIVPSSETWNDGDTNVICLKTHIVSG